MEYARFPQAAAEPPRAYALRGLIQAFPPAGVSHIPFARFKLSLFSTRISLYLFMLMTFMVLGHNIDYYEVKGFGEETLKYFTNYPIGLLIFWTMNILCGIISPILLLFRTKLAVWVAFISAVSMFLLEATGFLFMNRWEALGTFVSLFDIGLLILTWIFFFYCSHLKKNGILEEI